MPWFASFPTDATGVLEKLKATNMGRGILLWMLGVPLPIILLLAMCSHR
jgi:hypothetical protein